MHGAPIIHPKDATTPVQSPLFRSAVISRLRAAGCVFAEAEADLLLSAGLAPDGLMEAVQRRVDGFPLEHILGWAEFCGLRIRVQPGVFVPRRRTELLVQEAATLLGAAGPEPAEPAGTVGITLPASRSILPVVVDLCCGSGAVGTALAARVPGVEVHASDVDPTAVRCASLNVVPAGGAVHEGDLYSALPARLRGAVDILAVNAPYVPTASISSMPHEARVHEPRVSLDGGPDGLDIQRRVIAEAAAWLMPGGHLLIETSRLQAPHTAAAMVRGGLRPRTATSAELDATVVIGQLL
jgi:release factor glutamine methyltransferase